MVAIPVGKIHYRHYYNANDSGVSDNHNYEDINTGDGRNVSLRCVYFCNV